MLRSSSRLFISLITDDSADLYCAELKLEATKGFAGNHRTSLKRVSSDWASSRQVKANEIE